MAKEDYSGVFSDNAQQAKLVFSGNITELAKFLYAKGYISGTSAVINNRKIVKHKGVVYRIFRLNNGGMGVLKHPPAKTSGDWYITVKENHLVCTLKTKEEGDKNE